MNSLKLFGAAGLAAAMMAAPALAQNSNGTNTYNPAPYSHPYSANNGVYNNGGSYGTFQPNGVVDTNRTSAIGGNYVTGPADGRVKYAGTGEGSYTAERNWIRADNNNNNNNGNFANNWRPSQRNPLLADNGDARASKVIGTKVYDAANQSLGDVKDILIGSNGVYAVINTNNQNVAVPFSQLRFGDAANSGNEKLVLPSETQAELNSEPVIHWNETKYPTIGTNSNNGNNNGNGAFSSGRNNGYGNMGNNGNNGRG